MIYTYFLGSDEGIMPKHKDPLAYCCGELMGRRYQDLTTISLHLWVVQWISQQTEMPETQVQITAIALMIN